ncbi:MAG: hypothetical protein HRT99_02265 [Mycoplasmatales bacterium]|nr:hypothetical protein [Mycoplasmatales bacterium]
MKLSKILELDKTQIEGIGILDIDFQKNMDVPYFFDIQTITNFKKEDIMNIFLEKMTEIIKEHESDSDKIKFIQSEVKYGKYFGLGYSKGKEKSFPRGAKKEPVINIIKFVKNIKDQENKYKNIGLFRQKLTDIGKDGFSDIYINGLIDILLEENRKLINKFKDRFSNENDISYEKHGIKIIEVNGHEMLEYENEKRYLTNINWVITNNYEEETDFDTMNQILKHKKPIKNEDIREKFQKLIEYKINDFDLSSWKEFVDRLNNVQSIASPSKLKTVLNKMTTVKDIEILASEMAWSSMKKNYDENEIKERFRHSFISENIDLIENKDKFDNHEYVFDRKILKIKCLDDIEEIKEEFKKIKSHQHYSENSDYNGYLIFFTTREIIKKLDDFFKNESLKNWSIINVAYNFLTKSRFEKIADKNKNLPINKKVNVYKNNL